MKLQWQALPFDALSLRQLYELGRLRQEVFVVEQAAAYLDFDGKDYLAYHVFAEHPDGRILAYARWLPPSVAYPEEASLGRVVNHPSVRGTGVGRELVGRCMALLPQYFPNTGVRISAQTYLKAFYEGFGFVATDKHYLEDGLPHVEMYRLP